MTKMRIFFSGTVVNTGTVITFQGSTVDEIENEFRASIDDYLEWCREDGIELEKPYSGRVNVRFEPELHRRAAIGAKLMGISLIILWKNLLKMNLRILEHDIIID